MLTRNPIRWLAAAVLLVVGVAWMHGASPGFEAEGGPVTLALDLR